MHFVNMSLLQCSVLCLVYFAWCFVCNVAAPRVTGVGFDLLCLGSQLWLGKRSSFRLVWRDRISILEAFPSGALHYRFAIWVTNLPL